MTRHLAPGPPADPTPPTGSAPPVRSRPPVGSVPPIGSTPPVRSRPPVGSGRPAGAGPAAARSPHRTRARISAVLLALLLVVGPLLSPDRAPAASAAGLGPTTEAESARALGPTAPEVLGPGRWHRTAQGRTWFGAYRSLGSGFAYCVDAGRATPLPRFFTGSTGRSITSPQTAWALHTHTGVERRDVQSALSALAKLDPQVPHRHVIAPEPLADLGPGFRGAAAEFTAISADAERFAGPYTLHLDIAEFAPGARSTAVRIRLESAAGELVPGIPVDLEAAGGLLGETSVVTAAEPVEATLHAIPRLEAYGDSPTDDPEAPGPKGPAPDGVEGAAGSGSGPAAAADDGGGESMRGDGTLTEVHVTARAREVPPTTVRFHEPHGAGASRVQSIIAADAPGEITRERSRAAHPAPEPSPPPPTPPATPAPTPVPLPHPSPSSSPEPEPSQSPEPAPSERAPSESPASPAPEPEPPAEPGGTPSAPSPPPSRTPQPSDTAPPPDSPPSGPPAPETPAPSAAPAEPTAEEPPAQGPAPQRPPGAAPAGDPAPAAPPPAASDELPRTGPAAGSRALLGLSLVLIGAGTAALLLSGRSRRR